MQDAQFTEGNQHPHLRSAHGLHGLEQRPRPIRVLRLLTRTADVAARATRKQALGKD